jgi:hypothetical protein
LTPSSTLSPGAVAGIVIGVLAFIVLVGGGSYYYVYYYRPAAGASEKAKFAKLADQFDEGDETL